MTAATATDAPTLAPSTASSPVPAGPAAPVPEIDFAVRSAERAIQRLVLVVAPPWMLAMLSAGLSPDSLWSAAVVATCGAILAGGYAWFLLVRPRRSARWLVPVVGTVTTIALASPPGLGLSGYPLVATWLNLACFSLGALIRRPGWAVLASVTTAVGVLGLAYTRQVSAGFAVDLFALSAVLVYALNDGLALPAAVGVLRRTARQADDAAQARAEAGARAASAEASREELRRVSRLLHDTVVNTLGAVARLPNLDTAVVASRCAKDLELLHQVDPAPLADPAVVLASANRRAGLLGLSLQVDVRSLGPALDSRTGAALEGAAWEALNNVAKHAGVSHATLEWSWDGSSGRMTMRDDGVGYRQAGGDPSGWSGGARESLARRCREAGVRAVARSQPGHGTTVELSWTAKASAGSGEDRPRALGAAGESRELSGILAETVVRVTAVLGGVGLLALWAMPAGWPRAGNLAGLLITAGIGLYAFAVQRGAVDPRAMPWWGYPLLSMTASFLPGVGLTGCSRAGMWWWGPLAGLAVAAGATMLDRRRSVVVLTGMAYVIGNLAAIAEIGTGDGTCHQESLSLVIVDAGVIVAMSAYANRLAQVWAIGRAENERMVAELAAAARADAAISTRRDLIGLARTVAEPVMRGLADRSLDPTDPGVQAQCDRAEVTLRALSFVPSGEGEQIRATLVDLIMDAHHHAVRLTLTITPGAMPTAQATPWVQQLLAAVVPACLQGSAVQVTFLRLGDALSVTALLARSVASAAADLDRAGWSVTRAPDGLLLAEAQRTLPA